MVEMHLPALAMCTESVSSCILYMVIEVPIARMVCSDEPTLSIRRSVAQSIQAGCDEIASAVSFPSLGSASTSHDATF